MECKFWLTSYSNKEKSATTKLIIELKKTFTEASSCRNYIPLNDIILRLTAANNSSLQPCRILAFKFDTFRLSIKDAAWEFWKALKKWQPPHPVETMVETHGFSLSAVEKGGYKGNECREILTDIESVEPMLPLNKMSHQGDLNPSLVPWQHNSIISWVGKGSRFKCNSAKPD